MKKNKELKKPGAKALPLHKNRIEVVNKKMKLLNISVATLKKALPLDISYNSIVIKLKGAVGLHLNEINAIEKTINEITANILKSID